MPTRAATDRHSPRHGSAVELRTGTAVVVPDTAAVTRSGDARASPREVEVIYV